MAFKRSGVRLPLAPPIYADFSGIVLIPIRPLHPHRYPRNRAENGNAAFLRSEQVDPHCWLALMTARLPYGQRSHSTENPRFVRDDLDSKPLPILKPAPILSFDDQNRRNRFLAAVCPA